VPRSLWIVPPLPESVSVSLAWLRNCWSQPLTLRCFRPGELVPFRRQGAIAVGFEFATLGWSACAATVGRINSPSMETAMSAPEKSGRAWSGSGSCPGAFVFEWPSGLPVEGCDSRSGSGAEVLTFCCLATGSKGKAGWTIRPRGFFDCFLSAENGAMMARDWRFASQPPSPNHGFGGGRNNGRSFADKDARRGRDKVVKDCR
jgi:hypothetical protein